MSPRIRIGPEPVLAAHVPSPPAAGSHCPAREDSAPQCGTEFHEAQVVVGEPAVTAAHFFDSAGRPSHPFWGPKQGNKLVLWESLDEEEQVKCWKVLEQEKGWVVWCS
jgi:hypothetical protein